MKTLIISIITIFAAISSCSQESNINSNQKNLPYREIGKQTITVGYQNRIIGYKMLKDSNYLLDLRTSMQENGDDDYNLTITPRGDSVNAIRVSGSKELFSYEELNNNYYQVFSCIETREGHTSDFLYCYDKNWNVRWSKPINDREYYDEEVKTILTLTSNHRIIVVSNEKIPKSNTFCIAIRLFDMSGLKISEKLIPKKGENNPVSFIKSYDNNFFLTVEDYNRKIPQHFLTLIKVNQRGDTLWSRKHPNFFPHQTMLSKNGDLVFFGYYDHPQEMERIKDDFLKIIVFDTLGNFKWEREINKFYDEKPGNFIETKDGNYLFSSAIKKAFNHESLAYIFEFSRDGKLTFEKQFDYHMGISNLPFLIRTEGQITLISQKHIGIKGNPFNDNIQIIKLSE